MSNQFETRYKKLNKAQKLAVDTIDGPVLVVAGPGSGKTEILSLRVANILKKTDTSPSNILCLTFTEAGASNMRSRLVELLGQNAYRVAIHTFHSFALEIINRHREFFYDGADLRSADKLIQKDVLRKIIDSLSYDNPLVKRGPDGEYINFNSVLSDISLLKRAGLTPANFLEIVEQNEKILFSLDKIISENFSDKINKKDLPLFEKVVEKIRRLDTGGLFGFESIAKVYADSLSHALELALSSQTTGPITNWKKEMIHLEDSKRMCWDTKYIEKHRALALVYEKYVKDMHALGYYDFDDMIMDTLIALESNESLRYILQEEYQYILVDEFQDTNNVQMRMVDMLTSAHVHEGRPNIMVVGDDDQAIYKFQGAELSNILNFGKKYKDPVVVTMTENYRSAQPILDLAQFVIKKGGNRLEKKLPNISKVLKASNEEIKLDKIERYAFPTASHEYFWIAKEIAGMIKNGKNPNDIAVIGRKHESLREIVTYLYNEGVPVSYERQRNVLREPHIRQIIAIASFAVSLAQVKNAEADELLPEILSFPFWNIPRIEIWKLSVKARGEGKSWLEVMIESENKEIKDVANFLVDLGVRAKNETLEEMLDTIIGSHVELGLDDDEEKASTKNNSKKFISPFRQYYWSKERFLSNKLEYLVFLSGLRVFVQALREYRRGERIGLSHLVEFVKMREDNNEPLQDSSPFSTANDAVSLVSAHSVKGLEFDTVFLLHCQNEHWVSSGKASNVPLPSNLPISPENDNFDDKLRIFFVSLTRAKRALYMTYHVNTEKGKKSDELEFLLGDGEENISNLLGDTKKVDNLLLPPQSVLEVTWENYNRKPFVKDESALLKEFVKDYQMSATHFNNFLDIINNGPEVFFEKNLLLFPEVKKPNAVLGTAVHKALEILYVKLKSTGQLPKINELVLILEKSIRDARLPAFEEKQILEKGKELITLYYKEHKKDFNADDLVEYSFKNQGVVVGGAHLTGKIDRMTKKENEIIVYDVKTGSSFDDWDGYEKAEKKWQYENQLYFYKILVENSRDFSSKYVVNKGVLQFLEPDREGHTIDLPLYLIEEKVLRTTKLIEAVYKKIINLDFPDITKYKKNMSGIKDFENDLIEGKI